MLDVGLQLVRIDDNMAVQAAIELNYSTKNAKFLTLLRERQFNWSSMNMLENPTGCKTLLGKHKGIWTEGAEQYPKKTLVISNTKRE